MSRVSRRIAQQLSTSAVVVIGNAVPHDVEEYVAMEGSAIGIIRLFVDRGIGMFA